MKQNPTDAEVQDMINEVDVDGSGALDFSEFCLMMLKKMSETNTDNETQEAYRVFDKEKEGFISRAELRMIFAALPERLTEEEIEEMLEVADEDGNDEQWLEELFISFSSAKAKTRPKKLKNIHDGLFIEGGAKILSALVRC